MVVGLNDFQMMDSQMLVAMNSEIPLPRPQPRARSSSRQITITPAMQSCNRRMIAQTAGVSEGTAPSDWTREASAHLS